MVSIMAPGAWRLFLQALLWVIVGLALIPAMAQDLPTDQPADSAARSGETPATRTSRESTDAEHIVSVQKLLEVDRRRLAELEAELDTLQSDFAEASAQFGELDATLTAGRMIIQRRKAVQQHMW